MSCLKLSMAATSIRTIPYKWVRTITTTTKPTVSLSSSRRRRSRHIPFSLLSLDVNWRTLRACAPLNSAAHISRHSRDIINDCCCATHKDLGFRFRFRGPHCVLFSSSSSSLEKGGSSGSAGSGLAAEMGQDNDVPADQNGCCSHEDRLLRQKQLSSPQQQQQQSSKLLTLPTILTLGRVAAVPLLVATFYIDSWWGRTATTSIFVAAAITDWLDGYIARKMRLGSAFGAFLDPVADKLMVAATLILLCTKPMEVAMFGEVPWLLTVPSIAIIGREITMSAVREWAASQNSMLLEAVAVNNLGKWKTATQMIALTILLGTRDCSHGGLVASGVVLLYISAGFSIWSLAVYMGKIWKVLLK